MRTIRTKIYLFDELSKEAQNNAIENFRNINVDFCEWFDADFEGFKEDLNELGFINAEISFSGFYSQGDGACFDAKIDASKFAETINEKRIAKLIKNGYISEFEISKTSYANHYSHEKTRFVDFDSTGYKNIDEILQSLCEKIEVIRLEKSKEIYKSLEQQYDYLQSDEAVKETIIANDYEFTKDGKQF
jgi:hypothetical protein